MPWKLFHVHEAKSHSLQNHCLGCGPESPKQEDARVIEPETKLQGCRQGQKEEQREGAKAEKTSSCSHKPSKPRPLGDSYWSICVLNRPKAKGRKYGFFFFQLIAEVQRNATWRNLELKASATITLCKWENSTKCLREEGTRFSMWCA